MSTSSTHLDGWKRGLQDRIHRILVVTIIHHLVGSPFSLWKLYNIPWSPPIPISSSFTSWLRDFPRRMLYPNESSEPWLPRSMLYSLVFNAWSDHFFGHKNGNTWPHPPIRKKVCYLWAIAQVVLEHLKSLAAPAKANHTLGHAPRFEVPKSAGRSSKHSSIWPLISGSPSWLWASEGLNLNLLKHTLSITFMHVTTDMWPPIGTPEDRKHHHADSDECFSNMQVWNVDTLIPTTLQSASTAGCLRTASLLKPLMARDCTMHRTA